MIRTLRPWSGNGGKRLVRAPKVYLRDSGITHAVLNLTSLEDLFGHPVAGPSCEGFVLENRLSCLPPGFSPWFYRTAAGAEIDLVIEKNNRERIAIEIKPAMAPSVSKGFYIGCEDLKAGKRFIVYPGKERFPISKDVTVIPILEMMNVLEAEK